MAASHTHADPLEAALAHAFSDRPRDPADLTHDDHLEASMSSFSSGGFASTNDPLEAALSSAFTDAPIPPPAPMVQVSASPTASISPPDPPPVDASPGSSSESDEQYEHLQKQWRAESAIAREKAERTRETYVAIREREERERKKREPSTSSDDGGWETVSKASRMTGVSDGDKGKAKEGSTLQLKTGPVHTPSPADVRDLTAGEGVGGEGLHALESMFPPSVEGKPSEYATPLSKQWEEISSRRTSYPSISSSHHSPPLAGGPPPRQPLPVPSLTARAFSSNLTLRSRTLALLGSLAINMLLPFVNGVMVGFGEIFARNVLGPWFGFGAVAATAVGIRAADRRR